MCGIAGRLFRIPIERRAADDRLTPMMRAIVHRGPDGDGRSIFPHAALGHLRLSIIDLTTGDQPMASTDGRCRIVYNGEIYNYEALREDLLRGGYPFHTHSDTEVILALYQTGGWKAFSRLRGMFAFVIWDEAESCAWLARDPIGIKPLFVSEDDSGDLLFGSEAKAIVAGGHAARLDPASLHLLMNFRYVPGDGSLFEGIRQLPPGCVRRWSPREGCADHFLPAPAVDRHTPILEAIEQSVDAHLTADVEVGGYLSGGIDSAAVSALASRHVADPYRTFTLEVGDDPDEARNAASTARLLNIGNLVANDPRPPQMILPRLIHALEAPKVNSWQVYELARFTSGHVKVALSGLGGDELFYGYNIHGLLAQADRLHRVAPERITRAIGGGAAKILHLLTKHPWSEPERAALMVSRLGSWPRVYGLLRNAWDQPDLRARIYGPRMMDARLPDAFEWIEREWPGDADPVSAAGRFEWRHKMVNDLLWQEDRCSMAHGLEVRVPFVDQTLASAVARFSRPELMPGRKLKGLLRRELAPCLPSDILQRPKSGFQVDAGDFFQRHLTRMADVWLSDERVRQAGLFNPDFVRMIRTQAPRKALRWHFFMLYLMLGAHLWIALFEQGNEPDALVI